MVKRALSLLCGLCLLFVCVQGSLFAQPPPTYLVGDCFPWGTDADGDLTSWDVGEFGDNALNNLDLIYLLRAVTKVPGYVVPFCSDIFDAMDSFPVDTETQRGGNRILDNLDLISTLRRVTNVDPSRPRRQACDWKLNPQGCCGAPRGAGLLIDKSVAAAVQVGPGAVTQAGQFRVPVFLTSKRDITFSGFSVGLGFRNVKIRLRFQPAAWQPTLVDTDLSGFLSAAWLTPMNAKMTSGQALLLGYVETAEPLPSSAGEVWLELYGAVANEVGNSLPVGVDFARATRVK